MTSFEWQRETSIIWYSTGFASRRRNILFPLLTRCRRGIPLRGPFAPTPRHDNIVLLSLARSLPAPVFFFSLAVECFLIAVSFPIIIIKKKPSLCDMHLNTFIFPSYYIFLFRRFFIYYIISITGSSVISFFCICAAPCTNSRFTKASWNLFLCTLFLSLLLFFFIGIRDLIKCNNKTFYRCCSRTVFTKFNWLYYIVNL